jgi:long-chain acyl-CoA synthetase
MATTARGAKQAARQVAKVSLDPTDRINERTTVGVFVRQAQKLKDRPLLHHFEAGKWVPITWAEMRGMVLGVAAGLIAQGVKAGDSVILMSENRWEWLVCDNGIQAAGAVAVPIYPSTTPDTTQLIARDCAATLAIASDQKMAAKFKTGGKLKKVVRMDKEIATWARTAPDAAALEEIGKRLQALDPEGLCTIIYTSGTTGQPKGVMLAHRNFVDMARSSLQAFEIGEDDVSVSFLPYAHVFERMSGIFVGQLAGASTYLSRGIDKLADDVRELRPTLMVSVPRVYEKMHAAIHQQVGKQSRAKRRLFRWAVEVGRRDAAGKGRGRVHKAQLRLAERLVLRPLRTRLTGGRLRFFVSGGAPLNPEVEQFFWGLGIRILQGWGLTETTSGATSNTERHHRFGTVGKAMPGVEIKTDKDGEILVKGPGVMLGYYNNDQATKEVLENGWFRTGDIGELDKAGFLRITDRKKDLLKTAGGKYVAPQPIESRLMDDRVIERAVLIGDERPYVTALLVPDWETLKREKGLAGKPEELVKNEKVRAVFQERIDGVNKGLGSWESVKYFELLANDFSEERGEMTPTLKVKRKAIAENYKEQIESMYRDKKKPA